MTVRQTQRVHFKGEEHHLPFSFLSQKNSSIGLPSFMTCRGVEVIMKGTMERMQNLTVGPGCRFVIKDSTETEFSLGHVVVQTSGYLAIERKDQKHVTMLGEALDIRGGGKVSFSFVSKYSRTSNNGHLPRKATSTYQPGYFALFTNEFIHIL